MSDFLNQFPTGGYQAVHKGNRDLYGYMTPNFESHEGMRFGQYHPAPFLSTVRYENIFQDFVVIGAGKPVCIVQGAGDAKWIVPAGFKLLIAAGGGAGPQYSQTDIDQGILDAEGNVPSVGDYVVDAMISAGLSLGACIGVTSYDAMMQLSSDPSNPATFKFHNYNRQNGIAVLTDYVLEMPIEPLKRVDYEKPVVTIGAPAQYFDLDHNSVVSHSLEVKINGKRNEDWTFGDNAGTGGVDRLEFPVAGYLAAGDKVEVFYYYEANVYGAPWGGISSWRGAVKPGDFVTFNADSAFVAYSPGSIGDTSAADESANIKAAIAKTLDILGQVILVDYNFPKQLLDKVKTAHDPRLSSKIVDGRTGTTSKLDRMPGSATGGAPHNVWYAGGDTKTGIVRFNMNIK